jgi:UrcA family protein
MKNVFKTQSHLAKFMVAASFVGLGCAAIGANAQSLEASAASPTKWTVTYPVGYRDLDVSTAKGAKTLYLRIRFAAETLCESAATWGKKEGEACVTKAIHDAVSGVNAPLLTQYSLLHTKADKAGPVQFAKTN